MLKAYIDFRHPQLFLEEIVASADGIEDRIVRVTQYRKRDRVNGNLQHLFVTATAIHGDQVLRLLYPVGMLGRGDKEDKALREKADEAEKHLGDQLEEQKVEVRGGMVTAIVPEAA